MALSFTKTSIIITILTALSLQFYGVEIYEKVYEILDLYGNDFLIRGYLPDPLIRIGVRLSLKTRLNELDALESSSSVHSIVESFVQDLKSRRLTAEATQEANDQHYEVDTSFYKYVLGQFNKYSSTIYLTESEKSQKKYDQKPSISLENAYNLLNESEIDMLNIYIERAELCIGEECRLNVLDLGCGWGSFSLFYASKCPNCKIKSLSNSQSQIDYINAKAKEYGLRNLRAVKQNVNGLDKFIANNKLPKFDRIISIEMFEHMKNYKILLGNLGKVIACDGKLFVHMFVHKDKPYHFESGWMAKYFFTAGTMTSHAMLRYFDDDFVLANSWKVNGVQYSYTLETWLHQMDVNEENVKNAIANIYGNDEETVTKWWYLWRMFFIACSELFKYNDGNVWFVGHYTLTPKCT